MRDRNDIIIGVGDCQATADPRASLVTYALGSCLGITLYDDLQKVGGLLHVMLPQCRGGRPEPGKQYTFMDTGFPLLVDMVLRSGAVRSSLQCKVFGGAQVMKQADFFKIGEKNVVAAKEITQKQGIPVDVWEVGGQVNRTIRMSLATGKVRLKTPNEPDREL